MPTAEVRPRVVDSDTGLFEPRRKFARLNGKGERLRFVSVKVREDPTGVERAHVADLAVAEGTRS